jgi:hypothetical protein
MGHVDHEQIERFLETLLPDDNGWRFVEYRLDADESLTEHFTSVDGRVIAGPARVRIQTHPDHATDVIVRDSDKTGAQLRTRRRRPKPSPCSSCVR